MLSCAKIQLSFMPPHAKALFFGAWGEDNAHAQLPWLLGQRDTDTKSRSVLPKAYAVKWKKVHE